MEQTKLLQTLQVIQERLENLQKQRQRIPNAKKPLFPFASSLHILAKISNEENYLYREAAKLKEQLNLHAGELGKSSYSPELLSIFYIQRE